MVQAFDGPSSVFEEPSFFIFEEAKFDLQNYSGLIIQVIFIYMQVEDYMNTTLYEKLKSLLRMIWCI